jgi:circadian clock protein KaiB
MSDDDEAVLRSSTEEFERLAKDSSDTRYVLRLYVSGMTPRSTEAINNLKVICDEYLKDRYELEVIDIYKRPEVTSTDQIVATPTLVKKLPLPLRRLVGALSNEERVLVGLDLVEKR